MSTQTIGNTCPRCHQKQLRIIEQDDDSVTGICHNCGYKLFQPSPNQQPSVRNPTSFNEIMSFINNYAFVIAIVGLIIAFLSMSGVGSLSYVTSTNFDTLNSQIDSNFDSLNSSINNTNTNLTNQSILIETLQSNITAIELQVTELSLLNQNVTSLEQLVYNINQTVTLLNSNYITEQTFLSTTNCTLKITEYPNQNITDNNIFAELEITISNPNTTLHDTSLQMYYENAIWNVTSNDIIITPTEPCEECIQINWFANTNEHTVNLRLEWNTTDHPTTQVDVSELVTSLKVNNLYFNLTIETVTNNSTIQ